jgi:hypothetical protein
MKAIPEVVHKIMAFWKEKVVVDFISIMEETDTI